jgi:ferritin-like metal-binding protein YciE
MADPTARELKLIQYLNEAYGKEKQLETVLQAQIKLAQKPQLKKRLQEHLKETKEQARGLQKRIKELGGKAEVSAVPGPDALSDAVSAGASVANKALAAAKGPVQALRGTSVADNQLRNIRDAFWNEAEEIAHYNLIEALADQLGDKETVKLARAFRRQEERMQRFIEKQIPQLVREVVKQEVPAKERKPASASSRSSSRSSRSSGRSSSSSGRSSSSSGRSSSSSGRSSSSSGRSSSSSGRSSSSSGRSSSSRSSSRSSSSRSSSSSRGSGSRSRSSGSRSRS